MEECSSKAYNYNTEEHISSGFYHNVKLFSDYGKFEKVNAV